MIEKVNPSHSDKVADRIVGARVAFVHMDDPYSTLVPGDKGTIACVDDLGTVHIKWDKGSSLGAVYGEDIITKAH